MTVEIRFGTRIVEIEYPTIVLSTLFTAWVLYYFFSTFNTPDGGEDSVLFIKPVTILLVLCYPFVVWSALKIKEETPEETEKRKQTVKKNKDKDLGFFDRRRIVFCVSLAVYAIGLTVLGYLIPSVLFIAFLCYYLGVRNYVLLASLALALPAFLAIVFKVLIKVPVPLWP
jgi:hypothetical protein